MGVSVRAGGSFLSDTISELPVRNIVRFLIKGVLELSKPARIKATFFLEKHQIYIVERDATKRLPAVGAIWIVQ